MTSFTLPRGTADILPEEISLWQDLESNARAILEIYGYKEIRTPLFESTELFNRSVGQTSDIVQKQMLTLSVQKETDVDDVSRAGLALRPEGTASVVRAYLENNIHAKESLSKLYYLGPMFRGERPQKGRLRQFHQIGVEVIGPDACSAYLDAEVIALNVNLLKALGVSDFKLKINTLGSQEDKNNFSEFLKENLKKEINGFCADCQNRFERNVFRILDCKQEKCKTFLQHLKLDKSAYLSVESLNYFSQVKSALTQLGITFVEDPFLVRGLDYYTHTVFEVSCESLGSQDAIGAGGRYDNLVHQLGGDKDVVFGALGFALGMERILLAMKGKSVKPAAMDVFLVSLGSAAFGRVFLLLQEIRSQGISADMSYHPGSVKSQMRLANKLGAKYVLILGDDEIKENVAAVKDMANGAQEKVGINELIGMLKSRLH